MLCKYHQLDAESQLELKPFDQGSIYYCIDSGRIFLDPVDGDHRISISNEPIVLATEDDREFILAPIPDKLYVVLASKGMYIYNSGAWNKISYDDTELLNKINEKADASALTYHAEDTDIHITSAERTEWNAAAAAIANIRAITNDEIDAICGASIYSTSEVSF